MARQISREKLLAMVSVVIERRAFLDDFSTWPLH
jgi:hypothetical protein